MGVYLALGLDKHTWGGLSSPCVSLPGTRAQWASYATAHSNLESQSEATGRVVPGPPYGLQCLRKQYHPFPLPYSGTWMEA